MHPQQPSFFCSLLIILSYFVFSNQACHEIDHESLLYLSHSFTPLSQPHNWVPSIDCCHWEGIVCDQQHRVTHLSLPSRGLAGTISAFIANLTYLSHLNLTHNTITGSLPPTFFSSFNHLKTLDLSVNTLLGEIPSISSASSHNSSSLISMETLDLSSNRFHGIIQSPFIRLASKLVHLNVSHNDFTGPLPSHVCANYNNHVRVLDFSSNDFNGRIPLGFGKCSKLEIFRAGFNNLSEQIPKDIYGGALGLREISLSSNMLMGSIDSHIVGLSNLTILDLHANSLTGKIPADIGILSNLVNLLLQMNDLKGELPTSLFNCTNLKNLNLLCNWLQGNITNMDFSKLQKLTTLDLGCNQFIGQLPKSLYSCKSLKAIRLSRNKLGGQIAPEMLALQSLNFLALSFTQLTNISEAIKVLMNFRNLTVLLLARNFLNETLPKNVDFVGFQNLQYLHMGKCGFTGEIPTWLKNLHKLRVLDLANNQLRGSIPSCLGTLPDLFSINLRNNSLTGEFPEDLTELLALRHNPSPDDQTYLDLPVITELHSLKQEQPLARTYNQISNMQPTLNLSDNCLFGRIPEKIGQLKRLILLDLGKNEFSGNIPNQISGLTNLEKLDLSRNHLSGEIPKSLGRLNFLSQFNVSYNDLRGRIPRGTQIQSFDASCFMGNKGLCGLPLAVCKSSQTEGGDHNFNKWITDDDDRNKIISICLGFSTGFFGVCGSLWWNSKWRSAYFRFLIRTKDWIYKKTMFKG